MDKVSCSRKQQLLLVEIESGTYRSRVRCFITAPQRSTKTICSQSGAKRRHITGMPHLPLSGMNKAKQSDSAFFKLSIFWRSQITNSNCYYYYNYYRKKELALQEYELAKSTIENKIDPPGFQIKHVDDEIGMSFIV